MIITGWIVFVALILSFIVGIANSKVSPAERVLAAIINLGFAVWVLLALLKGV